MQTSLLSSSGNSASGSANAVASATNANATSDMFTKLLVAQIKNQDPTSPTDPSAYVNQLTQLSQTESLQNMASLTSSNSSILQSLQVLALGAQVGSSVMVASSSVTLGTQPVHGSFTLASSSSKTNLVLTGSDGHKHTITLGAHGVGDVPFAVDPAALGLAPGTYAMQVDTDSGEKPTLQVAGTLSSVKLSSAGSVVIKVSNLGDVSPSDITSFNGQPVAAPN